MNIQGKLYSLLRSAAIVFVLSMLVTTSALARGSTLPSGTLSGGAVLAPWVAARDYSLAKAAAATAYFNAISKDPADLPAGFPFQVLYTPDGNPNSFTVKAGTMFYVPVVFSDSRDAALWPFPNVIHPTAVSAYYFDADQLGAEYIRITVDGRVTNLGRRYAVGVRTPGIAEFNSYTVAAAFLTPMSRGTHTITIAARFTGADIQLYPAYFPGGVFEFEYHYTVTVR